MKYPVLNAMKGRPSINAIDDNEILLYLLGQLWLPVNLIENGRAHQKDPSRWRFAHHRLGKVSIVDDFFIVAVLLFHTCGSRACLYLFGGRLTVSMASLGLSRWLL